MKSIFKNKYMFVNSEEIVRPTYKVEREFSYNDFDNVYYYTGEESLDKVFDVYEMPNDYRKIAFEINSPMSFKKLAEDFITKTKFNIRTKKVDDKVLISGSTNVYSYDRFNFKSLPLFVDYEKLLSFYSELKDAGILEDYIKAIANFYKIEGITENIKKYKTIMAQYRNGEFGSEHLSLHEILCRANEKDLINQMSLYELQYLLDNSFGFSRMLFNGQIESILNGNVDNKKEKLKVKSLNKK